MWVSYVSIVLGYQWPENVVSEWSETSLRPYFNFEQELNVRLWRMGWQRHSQRSQCFQSRKLHLDGAHRRQRPNQRKVQTLNNINGTFYVYFRRHWLISREVQRHSRIRVRDLELDKSHHYRQPAKPKDFSLVYNPLWEALCDGWLWWDEKKWHVQNFNW